MTQEPENFAFVMNVGQLIGAVSYTLAPDHQLRRATPNEVVAIKRTLAGLAPPPHNISQFLWEQQLPHAGGQIIFLPESERRYFVIAFQGTNNTLIELEHAFDLAPLELEVGFTVLPGGAVACVPGRLFQVLDNVRLTNPVFVDVSAGNIDEIQTIHAQLKQHDHSLVNVENLAQQLGQLKALPHQSPLRFLGYFAVLESLITHSPQPSDPYDSITRQVKKKLTLLDRRFPRKIDYSPFGGAQPEAIWTKMYAYRSRVAHGGAPEFTGELAALHNHETALALIKEMVKAIIRQALSEPQLLLDLREC